MTTTRLFPGTNVAIFYRAGNPAEMPEDQKIFKDGYVEIIIDCNGRNPCFQKKTWKLLIVNQINGQLAESVMSPDGIITIPVAPDTEVESVVTMVSPLQNEDDGSLKKCAFVIVELWSSHVGRIHQAFVCNEVVDPEMTAETVCH